jgi:hypothetical protein
LQTWHKQDIDIGINNSGQSTPLWQRFQFRDLNLATFPSGAAVEMADSLPGRTANACRPPRCGSASKGFAHFGNVSKVRPTTQARPGSDQFKQ